MNKIITLAFLLAAIQVSAQQVTGKVLDAGTNKPLSYATVIYNQQKSILYTDSTGSFTLNKDSLNPADSIYIEFLGYKRLAIAADKLKAENIFRLGQQTNQLAPVVVANCTKYRNVTVNRRVGRITDYIGPGPETKFIILGRYSSADDVNGYVKTIDIYAGKFNEGVHVPVRIRWYDWDSVANMPGKELTTTSIIVYPYRKGWNSFALPYNTMYVEHGSIVIGLEFIYPVEYMQQYKTLQTDDQKINWLTDMNNRWSVGIQATKYAEDAGFYLVNNLAVQKYNSRGRGLYIKPAIKLTVTQCVE